MEVKIIDRFKEIEPELLKKYSTERPGSYDDILKDALFLMFPSGDNGEPDYSTIHVVDDGNYQGTRLFVIPEVAYQPDKYWAVKVDYGSCSVCDAFEANAGLGDEISEGEAKGNVLMALHMIQSMKEI